MSIPERGRAADAVALVVNHLAAHRMLRCPARIAPGQRVRVLPLADTATEHRLLGSAEVAGKIVLQTPLASSQ